MARAESRPDDPSRLEIRQVRPDDWSALRQARLAALTESPDAFASSLQRELGYDEQRWRRWISSAAVVGAWRGGRLAGTAAGLRDSAPGPPRTGSGENGAPGSAPEWDLVAMWVSPEWRGRGIADELVTTVCRLATADGATRVRLWVTDENPRATAFYERLGFRRTGGRQLVRPEQPDHWMQELARPV